MLNTLKKILGEDETLKLMAYFGGLQIYIPKRPNPEHDLYKVLSEKSMNILLKTYGGKYLDLPLDRQRIRQLRIDRIFNLHEAGHSVQMIARKVGISRRYVYMILKDTMTSAMQAIKTKNSKKKGESKVNKNMLKTKIEAKVKTEIKAKTKAGDKAKDLLKTVKIKTIEIGKTSTKAKKIDKAKTTNKAKIQNSPVQKKEVVKLKTETKKTKKK